MPSRWGHLWYQSYKCQVWQLQSCRGFARPCWFCVQSMFTIYDYNFFFLESHWLHWIVPPSHHSNNHQQDVFQAQLENRWCHCEPGILREQGALFGYPGTGPHRGMQSITILYPSFSYYSNQIENCLHKWQTGEHVDVQFSAAAYKNKFIVHLKRLEDFSKKTKDANIVSCLCMHMLKMAK